MEPLFASSDWVSHIMKRENSKTIIKCNKFRRYYSEMRDLADISPVQLGFNDEIILDVSL